MNVLVSGQSADFAGKVLAHSMARNRTLGIRYAHGQFDDVVYFYTWETQNNVPSIWNVVAASLHSLIQMKVNQIHKMRSRVRNMTLEEALELLVRAEEMESEIDVLQNRLEAMANG